MSNTASRIQWLALAIAVFGLSACGNQPGELIDDTVITAQAKAALAEEDLLSASRIDVEASNGEVQLSGFVNELEMRALAESIVGSVDGVRAVHNDIQVQPMPTNRTLEDLIDDGLLVTRVNAALLADPATSAVAINVESVNNIVQLSGFVTRESERQEAERVVAAVEGVREVRNDIQVSPESG